MIELDITKVESDVIMSKGTLEHLVSCLQGRNSIPDNIIDDAINQCMVALGYKKDPDQLEIFKAQLHE